MPAFSQTRAGQDLRPDRTDAHGGSTVHMPDTADFKPRGVSAFAVSGFRFADDPSHAATRRAANALRNHLFANRRASAGPDFHEPSGPQIRPARLILEFQKRTV